MSHFTNPIIWEDLPDLEVIRVDDTYYYSASTFAFSPGAPILKSFDLINWEYVGHSVPELTFGSEYYLDGTHPGAYVKGIWASTLGYRPSNQTFYWYGCIVGTGKTFIYTAKNAEGPWSSHPPIDRHYYDAGLLVDDDDSMYIAYGSRKISVARLSEDGMREVECQAVYTATEDVEGARMYKIQGQYYIWITKPGDEQRVLRSKGGPFGPYEARPVAVRLPSPVPGSGPPHQGSLVDTPDGKWYYMAFIDAYPAGRIPVLLPILFDEEGWPRIMPDGQSCFQSYPKPIEAAKSVQAVGPYAVDFTQERVLGPRWEWNHNPDNSRWSLDSTGLVLQTATLTENLFLALNTLTHRILGPKCQAPFHLDVSALGDGDRAGVVLFRDHCAYIGIHREQDKLSIVYVDGINMDANWGPVSNGAVKAEGPQLVDDESKNVWLRLKADVTPAFYGEAKNETRYATFEYSTDGVAFTALGPRYAMLNTWEWYLGYRFGVFNFATRALGGRIVVKGFALSTFD